MGIIVAFTVINSSVTKTDEYERYIATAEANAENKVPYTACMNYRKAFQIKCEDEKIYKDYVKQSKLINDDFYKIALDKYVEFFPMSENAYEQLCNYYYQSENYSTVISLALEAKEKGIANEKVYKQYLSCIYMYRTISSGFEEAGSFLGNVALVKLDGKYGYLSSEGSYMIAPIYDGGKPFLGTSTAVNDGKEWYMINNGGYKVARPSQKVDDLSFLSNGKILVSVDGKYGYTDTSFTIGELKYDVATNFKNGVAAVKEGKTWSIIDTTGKKITDDVYEDVIIDEYNVCINNGVIFVKKDDKYHMINAQGQSISDMAFDDVCPFVGTEPAAVCVDKKWGFVDSKGKMVIEPQYEKAKSFSIGLAPVLVDGVWGYINSSNDIRIENIFEDCRSFSSNGIAAVKSDGIWSYIKLLPYYN